MQGPGVSCIRENWTYGIEQRTEELSVKPWPDSDTAMTTNGYPHVVKGDEPAGGLERLSIWPNSASYIFLWFPGSEQ